MSNELPESSLLHAGRHLRLMQRGHWEYVDRTKASGAAVILALTDEGNLVLIEQFRPPVNARTIELPAGLAGDVQGFESEEFVAAARRELLEEAGYEAAEWTHLLTAPSSAGLTTEMFALFRARRLRRVGSGGGVEGESITVCEVPVAKIDAWLRARIHEGLWVDPKVYAGLWFLQQEV
jgi:ADP-ribose pyrophosphatase